MQGNDQANREGWLHAAVLAGDERAWRTLYEQSFDGVYAYVSWRCARVRERAEEIVQETWLTAVRRIQHFDPRRGSFAGWLCGIAANLLRNDLRRRQLQRVQPLNGELPATNPAEPEGRQRAEQVAAALTALPEHYEAVLRAKYLDQRSVAEIAQARNETPKGIESLLTRAREAFRKAYLRLE